MSDQPTPDQAAAIIAGDLTADPQALASEAVGALDIEITTGDDEIGSSCAILTAPDGRTMVVTTRSLAALRYYSPYDYPLIDGIEDEDTIVGYDVGDDDQEWMWSEAEVIADVRRWAKAHCGPSGERADREV